MATTETIDICKRMVEHKGDRNHVGSVDLFHWHEAVAAFDATDSKLSAGERWALALAALTKE